jgi:peroxiredoxin Q/BCP
VTLEDVRPSPFLSCLTLIAYLVSPLAWSQTPAPTFTPAPPAVVLTEGQVVPDLQIRTADGKVHRLGELRGKKSLLLTFFPRCFTGNCTSQLTSLRDAYPALQKVGVEVWAVSTDSADGPKGQRAFAKHLRLPFALVPDLDRSVCLRFGAVHTKEQMAARMSVLIDNTGHIAWIDKQISPRTHGQDVLERVTAVQPSITH